MIQWLRIHLPMQGIQVPSLVREDPTWPRAIEPVGHNYSACALEHSSHNYRAHLLQLLKPTRSRARALQQGKPLQWEARTLQGEKSRAQQWRPNTAKKWQINKLIKKGEREIERRLFSSMGDKANRKCYTVQVQWTRECGDFYRSVAAPSAKDFFLPTPTPIL